MKKAFLFAASAAVLCSCSTQPKYVVEGDIAGLEGTVYLFQQDSLIDSAVVKSGKFRFSGPAGAPAMHDLLDSRDGQPQAFAMQLILEPGTISIKSDADDPQVRHTTGTPANDAAEAYTAASRALITEYRDAATTDQRREAIEEEFEQLTRTSVEANRDNFFGVMLMPNMAYELSGQEILDQIAKFSPEMQQTKELTELKATAEQKKRTDVGQPYINILQSDAEGQIVTLTSVVACLFFEYVIQKFLLKQQPTIFDGSALITGVLLAFNVPSNLPVWIIVIGALVAIGIGKMSFGGLGCNIFNPALVGRVFLLISFPVQMTTWPLAQGFAGSYIDAQTGATPLAMLKEAVKTGQSVTDLLSAESFIGYKNMLIGNMGGSLGEVAALALLIGFAYMLFRRIITWHIPVSIFVTVIVFSGILNLCNPSLYAGPVFHLLSGGLMLGAIFMATDYVTSPMSNKGMIIYGIGIGLLTVVIRVFGAYPEGMSFAILIMDAFTPLINRYCKPVRFA